MQRAAASWWRVKVKVGETAKWETWVKRWALSFVGNCELNPQSYRQGDSPRGRHRPSVKATWRQRKAGKQKRRQREEDSTKCAWRRTIGSNVQVPALRKAFDVQGSKFRCSPARPSRFPPAVASGTAAHCSRARHARIGSPSGWFECAETHSGRWHRSPLPKASLAGGPRDCGTSHLG